MRQAFYALELLTPPTEEPVTLAELKAQIRAFAGTDEDSYITALGITAREWAETYTGCALLTQKWRITVIRQDTIAAVPIPLPPGYVAGDMPVAASGELRLLRTPVASVDSFSSVDANTGTPTFIAVDQYELVEEDSKWPRLVPRNGANWSLGTYVIEFTAGRTDAADVPQRFKQAILLHTEANYDRDPVMMDKLISAAEGLLEQERGDLGMA